MYTINAAYSMRQEDKVGSLEAGKEADFIVVDKDIFNVPIDNVPNTSVKITTVKGREVWRKNL